MEVDGSLSSLLGLPPELWIKIISFLVDFNSLQSLRISSSSMRELIDSHESIVYHRICSNLGYTNKHSFGSSSTIYPRSKPSIKQSEIDRPLKAARFNQKTTVKLVFNDIRDWKKFAQVKHRIDKQWRTGISCFDSAVMVTPPFSPIWRWKFDPDMEYWAMTSQRGGLTVVSSFNLPNLTQELHRVYSHLESSGPFLVTTNSRNQFLVWKRQDEAFKSECPRQSTETGFEFRDLKDDRGSVIGWETFNCSPMFKLFWTLEMPQATYCFKARAPYLVAGSLGAQEVYVWNLETGKIVEQYDVSERPSVGMFYIELDDSHIFLGGSHSISVYNRHNRKLIYQIADSLHRSTVSVGPSEWVAVHHDVRGGHLLALSRSGLLFWTPRYKKLLRGGCGVPNGNKGSDSVIMNLGQHGAEGHNLCVENGRAVVSVVSGWVGGAPLEMLFLLNLRAWTDLEDFRRDPPRLVVLFKVVPSFQLTSRIEMDSCGIYLTSIGMCFNSSKPIFQAWETLNDGYLQHGSPQANCRQQWLDSASGLICEQEFIDPEPIEKEADQVTKSKWLESLQKWGDHHARGNENLENSLSAILRLLFSDHENIGSGIHLCA
ncbi:expressed protein [Phakopsora pachyrhizi]|uniref:Expressed protein n=1 Tax=Phakopsora pachyrhizi TaxID=170000 RepID=A0AAV0BEA2_PHAPC|nr:expressed protein [Phakopsora pachyrhizi]